MRGVNYAGLGLFTGDNVLPTSSVSLDIPDVYKYIHIIGILSLT